MSSAKVATTQPFQGSVSKCFWSSSIELSNWTLGREKAECKRLRMSANQLRFCAWISIALMREGIGMAATYTLGFPSIYPQSIHSIPSFLLPPEIFFFSTNCSTFPILSHQSLHNPHSPSSIPSPKDGIVI